MGIVPQVFRERHFPCGVHCFGGALQEHAQGLGPSVSFGRAFPTLAGRGGIGRRSDGKLVQEGGPDRKKAFPQLRPEPGPRANQNQARAKRVGGLVSILGAGR